jgi:hypothetical protein
MRLARAFCTGLLPIALVGCLHEADRPSWLNKVPFLGLGDADTAYLEYVVIERSAGGEDINRRVWDRIDEQILPFEARTLLEDTGLRVGIAGESMPGPLRKMIEDPRTDRAHRGRSFALDKPVPLMLTGSLPKAEFSVPAADGRSSAFARDLATLGFEVTVRDGSDGKALVRLIPRARYRDQARLLPTDLEDREQATELFPSAGFEVALGASDYLVVGTDWYWVDTFGSAAFVGEKEGRPIQRLLVLRASRAKAKSDSILHSGEPERVAAPPLATQASLVRGARP